MLAEEGTESVRSRVSGWVRENNILCTYSLLIMFVIAFMRSAWAHARPTPKHGERGWIQTPTRSRDAIGYWWLLREGGVSFLLIKATIRWSCFSERLYIQRYLSGINWTGRVKIKNKPINQQTKQSQSMAGRKEECIRKGCVGEDWIRSKDIV